LQVKIQKTPYRVSVYQADGTTLIARQYDPATFRNAGWASDGSSTVTKIEDHWQTPAGERFEGLGERYDYLDQRGRDVHNYVYNQYQDQGANHRTYLSVPFYTNSAGYGVYVPSTRYSIFNLGTYLSDLAGFTVDTGGALGSAMDYYFFTGSRAEILDAYTATTARPELPPKWAFGLWGSANEWNTQAEVTAELANMTSNDIPHTAMVLEQWSDEATFYLWHGATYTPVPGSQALTYADLTFPTGGEWTDPKAMVTAAHNQGVKVVLWQIPVLKQNFDTNPPSAPQQHVNDRDYAVAQGYVLGDGAGGPYRVPSGQWFGDSTVPDFTRSDATSWWMSKRAYLFDDVGVDGLKTDGSESVVGRAVTAGDGRKGDELHNAYPNEYTRAYKDFVQTKKGGAGALFSRAGTSGAQANSIFWAGDQSSTFGAFQEAVRAGISAGQSGIPFWAWDLAGFTGSFPSSELYLRAAAQATFSPIMQYHSEKSNPSPSEARTPWNVQARTGDTSVVPTFRKFADTRMNLIPYLYTVARNSSLTGLPMMQAMSIAYGNDPTAAAQDQQYMFGRQLLVAPITAQGATSKNVYLPAGRRRHRGNAVATEPGELGYLGHGDPDNLADSRETHGQSRLQQRRDQPRQHHGGPAMKRIAAVLLLVVPILVAAPQVAHAVVQRVQFNAGGNYLVVEFLDDDLVHFELAAGTGPGTGSPLLTTHQVAKTDYPGPSSLTVNGGTLTTPGLKVVVDTTTLCASVTDTTRNPELLLTTTCPRNLSQAWKGLSFTMSSMQNAYGLGEQFFTGGSSDGDWVGRTRTPGGSYGNAMVYDTDNGPVGNAQIPVLFAVGASNADYGLFVDQVYKQQWDLTGDPWTMDTWGDQLRWYVMSGPDLPDLRKDYLELTGRSPVPPKKAFGLWDSEYGYDSWTEIDNTLAGLRAAKFPVDGFMLDVNWFGGVTAGSDNTRMGTLEWDTTNFPNPATKLASYKNTEGVGVMTIEESYLGKNVPEHTDMANSGYLVRAGCSTCAPVYLTGNDWWGRGGMIDWTQVLAGSHWHSTQRQPLIDAGVMGHWLDLGEPEMYDSTDWTAGLLTGKHAHADYHNLYNLEWASSIAKGYADSGVTQRPFMLARSGAGGIQRTGAAIWSGDIGSKLTALAQQQNAQLHMSMSGIDYYGSDIGGFRREMLNSDLNELYTQWCANSAWFDVPVRPHTENLCNCAETSPDAIGDVPSNLANLRQRYELTPYYYSLAHKAYTDGEPLVPPLVYQYQNDPNVREMGHEKVIGKDLLVGIVAGAGQRQRDVYLPAGTWWDYRTNSRTVSTGQWLSNVPLWRNGKFQLPVYARGGAILPKMYVDDKTMNVFGKRTDQTTRDELMVRVYADPAASSFTLAEDDGTSTGYQTGAKRTTAISQQQTGSTASVTIAASSGTYAGAPSSRANVVELVSDTQASAVTLNGSALTQYPTRAAFDAASSGWYNAGGNLVVAKSGSLSTATAKTFGFTTGQAPVSATFSCANGTTVSGQSVYAVGSVPQLGEWSVASAVKLEPTSYPTWTGTVSGLPPNTTVEWKCVKRQEAGYPDTADAWQPGANTTFSTPATGSAGTTSGTL
ncbi:MAG TPA: TIM-barrel domain-containing protein, partial [Kribbellaceae bacterium]|nr:TIM-barrel domain-containing protein [Kribbellaceae bacterium]